MKHLETSLKWLQKALNKHIVRLLTVIHNSPQRGSPGSNLIIAFKCDTVTCIGDKDPHEKWSVLSKEYSPSADINIKIVLHPGAISTTCTYVCFLVFAYANTNAHTHTYIYFYLNSVLLCDFLWWTSGIKWLHNAGSEPPGRGVCVISGPTQSIFFCFCRNQPRFIIDFLFTRVWHSVAQCEYALLRGGTRPATQN